jgi:RNA polymerase sigma-70 factor (ECF subfamily)
LTPESDETLVRRAMDGDRRAFAGLAGRYAAAVKAVAFAVVRDHHAAEDVAQDVFVLAMQRLGQLRFPSLFGRWILKMARHRAIRVGQSRRADLPLENAGEIAGVVEETADTETDRVLDAVMRLPERERRLVMLRFFNGHTIDELAKITNRPVGTVTKQLSRGYARLRAMLAEVMA